MVWDFRKVYNLPPGFYKPTMSSPLVTVILASYNHARFVGTAIESVLHQTFQDFELLVADDGSSDHSAEVIQRYKDPRIQAFCFPKNRAQHPRNFCLARARGRYIAILNSDDAFHPTKLAQQVALLEARPEVGAAFSWVRLMDEAGADFPDRTHPWWQLFQAPNRTRTEWSRFFFENGNCLAHASALIRKSALDEIGGYDPRLALLSDWDLWLQIVQRHELHVLPEALLDMRLLDGEANASGRRPDVIRRNVFEFASCLRHFSRPGTEADWPQVFPALASALAGRSPAAQRWLLAEHAMQMAPEPHRLFGLNLAYELLGSAVVRQELQAAFGSDMTGRFMQLTGKVGPFGELPYWFACFVTETPTGPVNVSEVLVEPGAWRKVVFGPVPVKAGEHLQFRPVNRPGVVQLRRLVVRHAGTGAELVKLSLPQETMQLRSTPETILLPTADTLRVACLHADPRVALPLLGAEAGDRVRIEVEMLVEPDWTGLRTDLAVLQAQSIKAESKLRNSFVSKFFRGSKPST